MRRRAFIASAAGVAALSGCSSVSEDRDQGDETWSEESQDDGAPGQSEEPSSDNSQGDDSLAGTSLEEADSLRIPVELNYGPDAREVTDIVLDALSFWEANASTYAGYGVEYERVDEGGYLTIDLQSTVSDCDEYGDVYGCATIPGSQLPDELDAVVKTSLTDQGVFTTAVHELGHTLGLDHDDDPQQYMIAEWASPWQRDTANVYLDGVTPAEDIVAGLEWLGEHSDAVQADVQQVTERSAAGIVVQIGGDHCYDEIDIDDFYLCSEQSDTYEDQRIIKLSPEMAVDVRAWHVAKTIARSDGDRPDLLSNRTPEAVRRSDWWNEE